VKYQRHQGRQDRGGPPFSEVMLDEKGGGGTGKRSTWRGLGVEDRVKDAVRPEREFFRNKPGVPRRAVPRDSGHVDRKPLVLTNPVDGGRPAAHRLIVLRPTSSDRFYNDARARDKEYHVFSSRPRRWDTLDENRRENRATDRTALGNFDGLTK